MQGTTMDVWSKSNLLRCVSLKCLFSFIVCNSRILLFFGNIERTYTHGEASEIGLRKPILEKYFAHDLALRECLHRLGKIGVRTVVARDEAPYDGHHYLGVDVEKGSPELVVWVGELEQYHVAAPVQYTVYLAEAGIEVLKVAYTEGHRDGIETAVCKGELAAVLALEVHDVVKTLACRLLSPHTHHPLGDVYRCHIA